jgi:hypothetical protein
MLMRHHNGEVWPGVVLADDVELADKGLRAGGELLALHDAYRATAVPAVSPTASGDTEAEATADVLPAVAVAAAVPVAAVTITWADAR